MKRTEESMLLLALICCVVVGSPRGRAWTQLEQPRRRGSNQEGDSWDD
jgi:hypothetical protein